MNNHKSQSCPRSEVANAIHLRKGRMPSVVFRGAMARTTHSLSLRPGQLQPGQTIAVEGVGTQNDYGRALEAMAVGTSPQTLQPIYERQAGRAAYAPPPPAPPARTRTGRNS